MLVTPALLCAGIAAASPPPLHLTLTTHLTHPTDRARAAIRSVTVRAANNTGTALTPHFASRNGQGASKWWTITEGPATLAPHHTAIYVVRPQGGHRALPTSTDQHMYLIAVTGSPMTISTASLGNATHPG